MAYENEEKMTGYIHYPMSENSAYMRGYGNGKKNERQRIKEALEEQDCKCSDAPCDPGSGHKCQRIQQLIKDLKL